MKFTKYFLLLCMVSALYFGCKKTSDSSRQKSSSAALTGPQLAAQLASGFYQSVTGKNGGGDLTQGINAPKNFMSNTKLPVINSTNPFCGFVVDTSFRTVTKVSDTISSAFGGNFHFVYNCTGDNLTGYTNGSAYYSVTKTTNTSDSTSISQNETVTALNAGYTLVSVNGTSGYYNRKTVTNGPFYYQFTIRVNTEIITLVSTYTLNNIQVDVSSGQPVITGGSVSVTTVLYETLPTDYADVPENGGGTITFIGNNLAKVHLFDPQSRQGADYTVNVVTGAIVS